MHGNPSDDLLADEVSDLHLEQTGLLVLVQVDVDGEMGVDVAHLVLESLGDTGDQVLDDGADGSESGDILTVAVMNLDGDGVLLGVAEVDSQVTEVLGELAYNPPMSEFPIRSCQFASKSAVEEFCVLTSDLWVVFRTSGTLNGDDTGLDVDLDYSEKKIQCQLRLPQEVHDPSRQAGFRSIVFPSRRSSPIPHVQQQRFSSTSSFPSSSKTHFPPAQSIESAKPKSKKRKMVKRTALWNFQDLLRVNVPHGCCDLGVVGALRVSGVVRSAITNCLAKSCGQEKF